jgi:hypothetical protein
VEITQKNIKNRKSGKKISKNKCPDGHDKRTHNSCDKIIKKQKSRNKKINLYELNKTTKLKSLKKSCKINPRKYRLKPTIQPLTLPSYHFFPSSSLFLPL